MDSADAKIAGGGKTTAAHTAEPLPLRTKLLYGAPSFAGAAMVIPIFIHMPKFYADVVLVPLVYLAMAIAIARSLDALSDPLMGWISDHTHTRLGRRRPYMLIGAPLCGVAFFCLLNPPASLTGGRAAIWFGVTFILYFIFHTVYVLPHYALGPELTQNYHERSTLFAWRESFTILGTIVAAAAPGVMMQAFHMTERQVFFRLGIFFGVLLSVLYGLLVLTVKERPDFVTRESNPLVPGVRRALRNRPFGILLGSYVVGSISGAIPATMMPFFNAYVIRPANPTFWLSMLLLGYFAFGFISLPFWVAVARRVGKLNAYLASFFLGITGGGAMFLLGPGDTWWLLVLICWAGIGFGAGLFLTPSMQADVIDYDELYTGKRREAQYTAFWSMLPKFVAIPSAAVPIAILASLGYIPNAIQAPRVVFAIRAIFALGPATCSMLSFLIARRFPITEKIHNKILEGIELHARGEAAVDPLTGASVPPPKPGPNEDVGWFLDYFSSGELKRYLARGASQPVRDVLTVAAISIAVSIISVIYVLRRVSSLSTDPGAMISLIVVAAGLAFAIFVFHLMRLGPARRLAAGEIPADVVRSHLGQVVEALREGTPTPVVATGVTGPS
ncbi:MAG TPA: MFS transporter [Candidatus Binatus sp.]|uniref:MFS transporter n=1 Tax=Candidatus Binatus sp. TaxID=2811406 RepID=UPI002B4712CC|nr:MFS transporter [Candidatus Binatus sp.]HKN15037.1 MFS transporter [Candidatus Binatus sp.]